MLFIVGVCFLLTRSRFSLLTKKISCALVVLGSLQPVLEGFESIDWYQPLLNLLPVSIGCLSTMFALCIPCPELATAELLIRLIAQEEAVSLLLQEQTITVLTREIRSLVHAELLLSAVLSNKERMTILFPAASTELLFMPWRRDLRLSIQRSLGYLDKQLTYLRAKQVTLRGMELGSELNSLQAFFESSVGQHLE
jgi:hypothetical protein